MIWRNNSTVYNEESIQIGVAREHINNVKLTLYSVLSGKFYLSDCELIKPLGYVNHGLNGKLISTNRHALLDTHWVPTSFNCMTFCLLSNSRLLTPGSRSSTVRTSRISNSNSFLTSAISLALYSLHKWSSRTSPELSASKHLTRLIYIANRSFNVCNFSFSWARLDRFEWNTVRPSLLVPHGSSTETSTVSGGESSSTAIIMVESLCLVFMSSGDNGNNGMDEKIWVKKLPNEFCMESRKQPTESTKANDYEKRDSTPW